MIAVKVLPQLQNLRKYKLKFRTIKLIGMLTVLLTGCVTGELTSSAIKIEKTEVEQLFKGNTAKGTFQWTKGDWAEYYNADGRVAFKSSEFPLLFGAWRVSDDGEICTKYFDNGKEEEFCSPVYRDEGKLVLLIAEGRRKGKINALIDSFSEGDTEKLMN